MPSSTTKSPHHCSRAAPTSSRALTLSLCRCWLSLHSHRKERVTLSPSYHGVQRPRDRASTHTTVQTYPKSEADHGYRHRLFSSLPRVHGRLARARAAVKKHPDYSEHIFLGGRDRIQKLGSHAERRSLGPAPSQSGPSAVDNATIARNMRRSRLRACTRPTPCSRIMDGPSAGPVLIQQRTCLLRRPFAG